MENNKISFPVGFQKLHKNKLFSFTMNRWNSIGFARIEDLIEAGSRIEKYDDWKIEMVRIGDKALCDSRVVNAAI